MKPEPLKDKGILEMKQELPDFKSFGEAAINAGRVVDVKTGKTFYYGEDIKSAVEWLKHELWDSIKLKDYIELIDEAFEDVIKK